MTLLPYRENGVFRCCVVTIFSAMVLSACGTVNPSAVQVESKPSKTRFHPEAPPGGVSKTDIDYGDWTNWNSTFDEDILADERFKASTLLLYRKRGGAALMEALMVDGFACNSSSEEEEGSHIWECTNEVFEANADDKINYWAWAITFSGKEPHAKYERSAKYISIMIQAPR